MIVVGIDPDSDKHGVAVYDDAKLVSLSLRSSIEIVESWAGTDAKFSIEDVMANQFVYTRNQKGSKSAQSKVAMHIGRVQQAQVELMRLLDRYGMPYELHKPQRGNWAKDKAMFERVTGWTERSNEDTRSAAFFGFLALKARAA